MPTTEPARRIFLVRHGETLYGATGGTDDLTPEGYKQIQALERMIRPITLDAIYASPLERAQATARTLAGTSGVPVTTIDTLREIMPGDLSVLASSGAMPDVAVFLRRAIGYFVDPETRWDTPYLGGETYRGLRERIWPFFADLVGRPDWRRVLIVAHGGVNNALIGRILGTGEPGLANIEQDFGGLNIIDVVEGRPVVRLLNFTAYDPLKADLEASSMDVLRAILETGLGVGGQPAESSR